MRSTTSTFGLAVSAGLALATVAPLAATAAPQAPQAPQPGTLGTLPATPQPATPDFDGQAASTRYVSVPIANVRSGPSMDARVVGSVRQGERVSGPIVNGWMKLGDNRFIGLSVTSTSPGGGGGDDDTPPPPADTRVHRAVSVPSANVRSGPSLNAPVVDRLSAGERVSGGWTGTGWLALPGGRFIHHSVIADRADGPAPAPAPTPPTGSEVTRYVDVAVANVRSGPGTNHRVVSTLRSGARVEGTKVGNWIRISDGRFISETVLRSGGGGDDAPQPPPTTQPTRGYVEVARANVRSGPGLNHGVVGTLSRGTEVKGSLSNGWVKMSDGRFISTSVLSQTPPGGGGDGDEDGVTGAEVLTEAAKYAGIMYVWGGTTPEGGFDCSGYTGYVFRQLGIELPRTAAQQRAHVTPVSVPKPGDLVFWGNTSHVAIYAGDGYIWDSGRPGLPVQKRKIFSGVTGYGSVEGVNN